MRPATLRNYLSDVRQFMAWCEATWAEGRETGDPFGPAAVTTPALTRYRAHLQHALGLKPASVNRALVSLKRYFAWAMTAGMIARNPAAVVKRVDMEPATPRQLRDTEEEALVVAVTGTGSARSRDDRPDVAHGAARAKSAACTAATSRSAAGAAWCG